MGRAERVRGANHAEVAAGMVRPTLAGARLLPLRPEVADLFPERGLRRGSTVAVSAGAVSGAVSGALCDAGPSGVTTLTLALLAAASASGSWCGMVSVADLGMVAAAEAGLDLERVALVPEVAPAQWAATVGVLLDAVEVVVAAPPRHLRLRDSRRLSTRARERQTVLIVLPRQGQAWGEPPDVSLTVTGSSWHGPDRGHGYLLGRRLEVVAGGRRAATRSRFLTMWLPTLAGGSSSADVADADIEVGLADWADASTVETGLVPRTGTAG